MTKKKKPTKIKDLKWAELHANSTTLAAEGVKHWYWLVRRGDCVVFRVGADETEYETFAAAMDAANQDNKKCVQEWLDQ